MIHSSMLRDITMTFKRIPNVGFSWALTPKETKDAYFEEFRVSIVIKVCVSWNNILIYIFFYRKRVFGLILGSMKCELFGRKEPERVHFSSFITYIMKMNYKKQERPDYVLEGMWDGLVDYWKKPDAIAKAAIARKARYTAPDDSA